MADHIPGDITIGGTIPRRLLDELAAKLAAERVGLEWENALDAAAIRAAIESAARDGQTVRFTDHEACGGQFEELEAWLTGHGIDFDRHSDAKCEWNAQNAYGRGRRSPVIVLSDQSAQDMVAADGIRKVLASRSAPARKLARIAKMVAAPPDLTPIILTD